MKLNTMIAEGLMVGCILFVGQAYAYTKLVSNDVNHSDGIVYVPKDKDFRLQCETKRYLHSPDTGIVSSEFRHRLFKNRGDEAILVDTDPADGCETVVNHTVKSNATYAFVDYMYTIFRVKAERAGTFTYGCMLVARDAEDRMLVSSRSNLTIMVCSEPHFSLNEEERHNQREVDLTEGISAVLSTKEKCRFNGAVSYLVNGVPVPRNMSSGDAPSPLAVERVDSSLEIHSPVCVGHRVCNVTARFTYIFEGNVETSHAHMFLNDCCIDDGARTTPMPTKATVSSLLTQLAATANTTRSTAPMHRIRDDSLDAERKQLEISKLELEIEVLKLKTELIPLQIIGRRNRISDVARKQLMGDEEDTTSRPV